MPQDVNTDSFTISNQESALQKAVIQATLDHFENVTALNAAPKKMRMYPESGAALAVAQFMIAQPEEKVDPQAEALGRFFRVSPRYAKSARRMLLGDCPKEIIAELRRETISVKTAEDHFAAFTSRTPIEIPGTHYLYVIAPEGNDTVAKVGITNDLRRRVSDLDPAGTHILWGSWKFPTRRMAKFVEDQVLDAYRKDPSQRERITDWDYQQILAWAIDAGGMWVPVPAGVDRK